MQCRLPDPTPPAVYECYDDGNIVSSAGNNGHKIVRQLDVERSGYASGSIPAGDPTEGYRSQ